MANFINNVVHRIDFYDRQSFQQAEHRTSEKALICGHCSATQDDNLMRLLRRDDI